MHAVEVTARFDVEGKVHPLRLRWQSKEYQIEAAGRRWQAQDGLHILVIAATGQAFELLFDLPHGRWYLVKTSEDQQMA